MDDAHQVEGAFGDEPDLREVRFELDDAELGRANPTLTSSEVELVRHQVSAGLTVRTADRARTFRGPRVRQASLIILLAGIVALVAGLVGSPATAVIGLVALLLGLAGSVLGRLPARPLLAGVRVETRPLGRSWADQRLRTSIRSITTVLRSRAYAEGVLDATAVRLSLTDQLAELRLRTAMINQLSAEIDVLPRAERRALAAGLGEAKHSLRHQVAVLGRYADQVRQLDAHLDHAAALASKEQLESQVDDLRARSAADPYRREEVDRLAVDARTAAAALREMIGQTQRDLLGGLGAGVDLAALVRRATALLARRR